MKQVFYVFGVMLLVAVGRFPQAAAQNREIDSLIGEAADAKMDTVKAKLFYRIGGRYTEQGYFDSAGAYLNRALTLARKARLNELEPDILNKLGINEYYRGNNPKAKEYWNICLAAAGKKHDKYFELDIRQNLANIEVSEGRYPQALQICLECLKAVEAGGDKAQARQLKINIGIIYSLMGEFENSVRYLHEAEKSFPPGANTQDYLLCLTNTAQAYTDMRRLAEAEQYYSKALTLAKQAQNQEIEVMALGGLAHISKENGAFLKAFDLYTSAIGLGAALGDEVGVAIDLERLSDTYVSAVKSNDREFISKVIHGDKKAGLLIAKHYTDSSIRVLKANEEKENLKTAWLTRSTIEQMLGNYEEALEDYIRYSTLNDSLFNMEKNKKLTQVTMQYEFDRQTAAAKAEQEKKDIRQRNIRYSISAGLLGALVFSTVVFRQRNKISKEKKRSDELLLNILPSETAEELKRTGTARAKSFEQVTVLFTDFKNFTTLSEQLNAQELVDEINYCYSAFDQIIGKHGIEKIKTIGDSYMCAGGLPVANTTNAEETVRAALEIRDFVNEEKNRRQAAGQPWFDIRIGCHTGPVVAGIVGIKKFAYDIWGDTVNTASRMESSGEVGKVNISSSTQMLVKDKFKCTYRGKIEAKNKGSIDMYFVENA